MNELLSDKEKDLMYLLIQGQTLKGILQWMNIDYLSYTKIKKSLLKKMKVKRITQLIAALIKSHVNWEYL